mmetsp:Transcript_12924/g.31842  ORF Transcript_12924/g.31842 Transcript_12924/m.31842 type:complete len:107 (-) Transcript_12924:974-1294(-)
MTTAELLSRCEADARKQQTTRRATHHDTDHSLSSTFLQEPKSGESLLAHLAAIMKETNESRLRGLEAPCFHFQQELPRTLCLASTHQPAEHAVAANDIQDPVTVSR